MQLLSDAMKMSLKVPRMFPSDRCKEAASSWTVLTIMLDSVGTVIPTPLVAAPNGQPLQTSGPPFTFTNGKGGPNCAPKEVGYKNE